MPHTSPLPLLHMVNWKDPQEVARFSAYVLAPALVLGFTMSVVPGRSLATGVEKPLAIAALRTERTPPGTLKPKQGVALIVEPVESEFRIPLKGADARIWSSLDEQASRANGDRLVLDGGGLRGKAPFLGVSGPVAVVVEGQLGNEIQVPGGTERLDEWLLPSRRSVSIVSSVLVACIFAFGMSLSAGLPSLSRHEDTAS